jgi:rhodanese-related sulfurtransferase
MPGWFSRLTLNQTLAAAALLLGTVALAASPYPGSKVTLDAKELALVVGTEADRIEATELAAWIIASRADYRLIDLRSQATFDAYHIPTAVNIPMSALTDAGFGRQEKLVIYSDGGILSAQAWMLLRAQGYRSVYMVEGGLEDWKDRVLFPVLADNATPAERARDDRARAVSAFFGGQPRSAAALAVGAAPPGVMASSMPAMPKVVAPPSPPGGGKPAAKKRKEGC